MDKNTYPYKPTNRREQGKTNEGERIYNNSKNRKAVRNKLHKENYTNICFKFNIDKEKDIIDWLDSKESLKGYIVHLINKDKGTNF